MRALQVWGEISLEVFAFRFKTANPSTHLHVFTNWELERLSFLNWFFVRLALKTRSAIRLLVEELDLVQQVESILSTDVYGSEHFSRSQDTS
jgi:hypothetical protein